MCNHYEQPTEAALAKYLEVQGRLFNLEPYEPGDVRPRQWGVFLRPETSSGVLLGRRGQWGLIRPGQPERIAFTRPKAPPGKKAPAPQPLATNNARIESIHSKPTYKAAWRLGQRCLIPSSWYAEPNWETKRNVWWHLKRADGALWMLAGLWSEWVDPSTGELVPNFTMITCNCTLHPLLGRLHRDLTDPKTGDPLPRDQQDKRSPVHVDPADWDRWLYGTEDEARALMEPQPADVFDQGDAAMTDELLARMRAAETRTLF